MQKISDSTNTANASGEYTEGNPAAGVAATRITARWLNTIQRELTNLINGSGAALNVADDGQVVKAVAALAGKAAEFPNITKKPTTLAGYGISDGYTKAEIDQSFAPVAYRATTLAGYGITDAYTRTEAGQSFASKSTTLAGYGITDAYTKTEAGQSFASKASTLAGYNIGDAYTKTQVDSALSSKADKGTTLAAYGISDAYTKTEAGQSFASKASTLAGYNIGDAYTKGQVDSALSNKADKGAATEIFAGTAAIATQNQTNSGTDNATIVTPRKLRAGFLSSFTENGFIAFPTWLGGLIIQWGRTAVLTDGSATNVSLPFTFPSTTLQMWTSLYGSVSGDSAACRVSAGQFVSLSQINVSYNETNSALGGSAVSWWCVGF
ncbi:hypothetical protein [Pseudomonas sp. KT_2_4]|uniref:gp53-like domain-containing protein n=1 Tax=Pseudomonas sp. KT_2_4 TaxID=3241600 RepID=UPI00352BCFB3